MQEIWKDIKDYEGLYQVSNIGRVRSLDRYVNNNGGVNFIKGKIMKTFIRKDGYVVIQLTKNNKPKTIRVHQLVANAFLSKKDIKCMGYEKNINFEKLDINHKNEIKNDNRVENLEWCTRSYNMKYGSKPIKDSILKGKIVNQYSLNGDFIKSWHSTREVERQLHINHTSINNCCNNKYYYKTAGGYIWRYVDKI